MIQQILIYEHYGKWIIHKKICQSHSPWQWWHSTRNIFAVINKPHILPTHFHSYKQADIKHYSLLQTTFIYHHINQAILDKCLWITECNSRSSYLVVVPNCYSPTANSPLVRWAVTKITIGVRTEHSRWLMIQTEQTYNTHSFTPQNVILNAQTLGMIQKNTFC